MGQAPSRRELLGQVIQNARKARGWGVSAFAAQIGVSRYTIINVERGHKAVGSDALIDILLALDLLSLDAVALLESGPQTDTVEQTQATHRGASKGVASRARKRPG